MKTYISILNAFVFGLAIMNALMLASNIMLGNWGLAALNAACLVINFISLRLP